MSPPTRESRIKILKTSYYHSLSCKGAERKFLDIEARMRMQVRLFQILSGLRMWKPQTALVSGDLSLSETCLVSTSGRFLSGVLLLCADNGQPRLSK